jgi:tight adherence protein B
MTSAVIGGVALGTAVLALVLSPLDRSLQPRWPTHPERAALADAEWRITPSRWELMRLAAIIIALLATSSWIIAGLAGAAPSLLLRSRAERARDRGRRAVPAVLRSAHAALRSGVALPEALRRGVAGCPEAIARRSFERALGRFDVGDPLDEALRAAARDVGDRRLVAALHTLAIGVSERLPLERAAALLEAVADRADHDARLDTEIRAMAAGIRLQTYVLAGVVPAIAVYLVTTMPGLGATLGSPLGRGVLIPVATALEIAGIVMGRHIVRSVTA